MASEHRYPWKWWLKDLKPPAEDAPTVFSTFACGGGSSMGYKRAGYHVLGNCEIDPKIAKVYERNLHPEMSYVMDLREFNTLEDLPECLYNLDVLDGSPPCSTFSMAGSREKAWGVEKQFAEGQRMQRLDDLFFTYLETVGKLRPKVFIAENVTGLIAGNAKGYVNEIIGISKKQGYDVQLFKLNAAFMGVPQRRERVFFIGNRMKYPKLKLSFNEPQIKFGEVRSSEPGQKPSPKLCELFDYTKKNDSDLGFAHERKYGKRSMFSYKLIQDNQVSKTVTAARCLIRSHDNTFFTDEDVVAVSSFPQDYNFSKNSSQFICGMSVPPSMMANIAHEIKEQWLDVRES